MDINEERIRSLKNGDVPIFEPGLSKMIAHNVSEGRLSFTTSIEDSVKHAEVLLIGVGTPPAEDGSADLSHVIDVASSIGKVPTPNASINMHAPISESGTDTAGTMAACHDPNDT